MRILILLSLAVLAGCPATTAINSDPPGADVYIDGEMVGTTPIAVRLSDWYENTVIRCEKEGYEAQERAVVKNTVATYGTTAGMATAYSTAGNRYGTGYGSTTVTGVQTTTQMSSTWPTEVYFRLEQSDLAR